MAERLRPNRRTLLKTLGAAASASLLARPSLGQASARIAVVG